MKTSERFTNAVRLKESNYFVTEEGEIFSNFNKTGRAKIPLRKLKTNLRNGYPSVRINIGNGIKHYLVHRLVAESFIIKENLTLNQVNHIDGIKTNNRVENLEWSNSSLNMLHAYKNGLMTAPRNRKGFRGDLASNSKAVLKICLDGSIIKRYSSFTETKNDGYRPFSISKNCQGRTQTYKGMKFIFEKDYQKLFETENNDLKKQLKEVFHDSI